MPRAGPAPPGHRGVGSPSPLGAEQPDHCIPYCRIPRAAASRQPVASLDEMESAYLGRPEIRDHVEAGGPSAVEIASTATGLDCAQEGVCEDQRIAVTPRV